MAILGQQLMKLNEMYRKGMISKENFEAAAGMLGRAGELSSRGPQRSTAPKPNLGKHVTRPLPSQRLPGGITKEVYGGQQGGIKPVRPKPASRIRGKAPRVSGTQVRQMVRGGQPPVSKPTPASKPSVKRQPSIRTKFRR